MNNLPQSKEWDDHAAYKAYEIFLDILRETHPELDKFIGPLDWLWEDCMLRLENGEEEHSVRKAMQKRYKSYLRKQA